MARTVYGCSYFCDGRRINGVQVSSSVYLNVREANDEQFVDLQSCQSRRHW